MLRAYAPDLCTYISAASERFIGLFRADLEVDDASGEGMATKAEEVAEALTGSFSTNSPRCFGSSKKSVRPIASVA